MLGAAATGSLKAATTITGVLNLLMLSLNNFAPVQASHALHTGGPMELRRYIGRLSGFSATLIIGCVAVLNIAQEQFVQDRKSVEKGKSVSVRVDLGGCRLIKKKNKNNEDERTI